MTKRPILVVLLVTLLAFGCAGTSLAASKPKPKHKVSALAGTWSGRYTGAFTGSFTLTWRLTGSVLNGSIVLSSPKSTSGIKGKVSGSTISFGALSVGATYKGSVSGKSMSGTYSSPQGGGHWSAHKTS